MEVCNLPRRTGKTTYLIYRSHVTQYPIVCFSEANKREVEYKAHEMKIDIPKPITVDDLINNKIDKPKNVLVDEALIVLRNILNVNIDTVTLSEKEF
jgi:hypothetical protein